MTKTLLLIAAGAFALSPTTIAAQTAPGQGQFNGSGYNHTNGPTSTGQPSQDCEALIAAGTGSDPGQSADNGNAAVSEGLKQHCCCCVLVHNTPAGDVVFSQPCPIARGRSHRRIALQVQCKAQGFAHSLGCKRPEPSLLVRRRHKSSGVFCLWEWRLEGRRLWRLDSRRRGSGGGLGE